LHGQATVSPAPHEDHLGEVAVHAHQALHVGVHHPKSLHAA
jgi:hypothetical protein